MLTRSAIQLFPKAELHCHLDGSIRPETLQKIAQAQGMVISDDLAEVASHMKAPASCQNLEEYLACFDFVLPYLQTSLALEMAAFDVMEQAYLDGIVYIEIRFAPKLSMREGLSVVDTIEAVAKGIAKAEKEYPVHGNLLVIGMRHHDLSVVEHVFSEMNQRNHEKVVGIDLAGGEEDGYVPRYKETLQVATSEGAVQLTLHAGECGCVANIFAAVEAGATRVGHGIALTKDKQATRELADLAVCIEGCPTSNVQTRAITDYEAYPMREWLEAGVHFCINTDNKTVSGTSLTKEYDALRQAHQLTQEELRLLNQHAMMYSFADDRLKEELLAKITNYEFNQ